MEGKIVYVVTSTYTYDDTKSVEGVFDDEAKRDEFLEAAKKKQEGQMFPFEYDWDEFIINKQPIIPTF